MKVPFFEDSYSAVYLGDCREVLPGLNADVVITDPPYGVDLKYEGAKDDREAYDAVVRPVLELCRDIAPLVVVTPGIGNAWSLPAPDWVVSWYKPGSTRRNKWGGFNEWEPVFIYGSPQQRVMHDVVRLPSVSNLRRDPEANVHPCPKPLGLLSWLVEQFTQPGDVVLDPFMGSGTTLKAAKAAGRQGVGIEWEEAYCESAVRWLAQGVLDLGFHRLREGRSDDQDPR